MSNSELYRHENHPLSNWRFACMSMTVWCCWRSCGRSHQVIVMMLWQVDWNFWHFHPCKHEVMKNIGERNKEVGLLTRRCGQRCLLLRARAVWTRDPETWRSFYTLLWTLDLILRVPSCTARHRGRNISAQHTHCCGINAEIIHCTCAVFFRIEM